MQTVAYGTLAFLQVVMTSVKISWIRRLFDNNYHSWKTLAKRLLHKVGGLYIFHFDLKLPEQSLYDVKCLPSFYKDLVLLWEKYSNLLVQREENKTTVFSQAIFNYKNLLIKGESIWHKHLYSQGTRIIGDLYDYEGSIKTWSVLSAEYHLGPESLVKAIPKEWKAILRSSIVIDGNLASENANNELYRHLSAKFVYKKLISNCFIHPTSQVHLLTKLNLRNVNWQTVYMLPRFCTIDSHTRVFQYKILNNIFYLNNRLFKMNIANSQLCSFCEAEPETIIHLLCSCRKVKQLWSSVQQWCSKCFSLPDLSPQTAVLGFLENAGVHIHQNLILLFFKKFVYEKRKLPSQIALPTFRNYLHYIYKIEHKIALKK